ncbi:unnamed protein product [Alternaria alternata]
MSSVPGQLVILAALALTAVILAVAVEVEILPNAYGSPRVALPASTAEGRADHWPGRTVDTSFQVTVRFTLQSPLPEGQTQMLLPTGASRLSLLWMMVFQDITSITKNGLQKQQPKPWTGIEPNGSEPRSKSQPPEADLNDRIV